MRTIALALLTLAACAGGQHPRSTPGLSKDEAVLEAVFLHELAITPPPSHEVACITVRGGPVDNVLAAIQNKYSNAKNDRECSGGGPSGPVKHQSGALGLRFDVGPVTWDGETASCAGGGGHREGPSHEVHYTLMRSGDGWKITGEMPGLMM